MIRAMAAASLTTDTVLRWLQNCADTFDAHKDELTQLDAAIGDADHGANMARGFTAVKGKLGELQGKDVGAIFKTVAMTLISTVGGASGPLYGTFFLQAANGAAGKNELTPQEVAAVFSAGLQGLIQRGKAAVGEKTMVDALVPAMEALKPSENDSLAGILDRAVAAAKKGADSTVPLVAKKGRASYLGERSAGHLDPGAASSVLLLESLQKAEAVTS
jgi:phosphoenolpyruvate---glycerone phosphotransferase subunit DhaL